MSYRRLKKLDINVLFKGQITVDTNGRYQMHITAYAQYIEIHAHTGSRVACYAGGILRSRRKMSHAPGLRAM